jgi:hypothetical protein
LDDLLLILRCQFQFYLLRVFADDVQHGFSKPALLPGNHHGPGSRVEKEIAFFLSKIPWFFGGEGISSAGLLEIRGLIQPFDFLVKQVLHRLMLPVGLILDHLPPYSLDLS